MSHQPDSPARFDSPRGVDAAQASGGIGRGVTVAWALLGVGAFLVFPVARLGTRGWAVLSEGLAPFEWVATVVLFASFTYGEGVMAIGRRWIPDVVARARALRDERSLLLRLVGPLYAISLVGADRRRLTFAWTGMLAILLAVLIVRALPYPWRGIVDFSVAGALAWGCVALVRAAPSAFRAER